MNKIDGYPHNGCLTDMNTDTERIFILRIRYEGVTTRILPALLIFLYTRVGIFVKSSTYRKDFVYCKLEHQQ